LFQKILLVLDGSPAARKASDLALELAALHRAALTALFIVDGGWKNILGDEWISSAGLRDSFFLYMDQKIEGSARDLLAEAAGKGGCLGLQVATLIRTGVPEQVLLSTWLELGPFDLVILPNPSGRRAEGAVKINLQKAARKLAVPLLIGPA